MAKIPDNCRWKAAGRTLGSGGQGVVELVVKREGTDERHYALKKLSNTSSPQARERFAKEVTALQLIDSPVIARVIDFAQPGDEFQYYVMEYFKCAKSLDKFIASDTNPYHGNALASLTLLEHLVRVVAVYEPKDPLIVHRDIKPANILILPDGSARLIDFGICQVDGTRTVTLVDENIGSRNYGAPECEAGSEFEIDIRADLYSLGKVLWSAMTSKQAFAREAPAFTNRSFQSVFPERPETWHLAPILAGTIRRKPLDRFRDTNGLSTSLREARRLIEGHFPPLENVAAQCPSCGQTTIRHSRKGGMAFGNPPLNELVPFECGTCGFTFLRNKEPLEKAEQARQGLE